jgi:CRISPR-associated protein Csy2
MKIAGGTFLNLEKVKLLSANTQAQHLDMLRKIKRLTMPGFILLDRNSYLQQHYQELLTNHSEENGSNKEPQLIDAWLDFSALKYQATPILKENQVTPDDNTDASWDYVSKPNSGYLVPLMTGYKAISEIYAPTQVKSTRDDLTPARFVEAIHSVGEWKSMHNTQNIEETIWRYKQEGQWYLCTQNTMTVSNEENKIEKNEVEQTQTLNINEALNLF